MTMSSYIACKLNSVPLLSLPACDPTGLFQFLIANIGCLVFQKKKFTTQFVAQTRPISIFSYFFFQARFYRLLSSNGGGSTITRDQK